MPKDLNTDRQVFVEQLLTMMGGVATKPEMKADSWENFSSGIGGAADKNSQTSFTLEATPPLALFEAMYRKDGISKAIVKAPAKDAMKNWIKISKDVDNKVLKQLKHLKAKKAFTQLVIHARKFGGGAILIQTKNGGSLSTPLQITGATDIVGLKNFSRGDFDILEDSIETEVNSPMYGEAKLLPLKRRYGGTNVPIHHSRLIIMKGEKLDQVDEVSDDVEDEYWGISVLEAIREALGYYGLAMKAISTLLQESTITTLAVAGLEDLLDQMGDNSSETSKEAWAKFQARIKAMILTKSVVHAILLDADHNESMTRDSLNFSGIPEIVNLYQMQLAGMSEIPITKLFGRSPAGENSTGQSDADNYDNFCIGLQEDVEPGVQILVDILTNTTDEHEVAFNHPDAPSEKQLLEMKKIQADIDKIYTVDIPALWPEELRKSRFKDGYSFETEIKGKGPVDLSEEEEETGETGADLNDDKAVEEYIATMQGLNQAKLDSQVEEIMGTLDKKGFGKFTKDDQLAALKAAGLSDAIINRMTNS